ncbi:hypothetical protein B0T17DRAFT_617231 [Bombardia bombarda]|uniref:Uncharacterized protein n=1 Tax=Bombardia bombarda TaxID=252184 RepID=A0AA39X1G0_9PEZI|nr:hypothetical protein B0T17DRAFT_617231 [Bombardia bombarda]
MVDPGSLAIMIFASLSSEFFASVAALLPAMAYFFLRPGYMDGILIKLLAVNLFVQCVNTALWLNSGYVQLYSDLPSWVFPLVFVTGCLLVYEAGSAQRLSQEYTAHLVQSSLAESLYYVPMTHDGTHAKKSDCEIPAFATLLVFGCYLCRFVRSFLGSTELPLSLADIAGSLVLAVGILALTAAIRTRFVELVSTTYFQLMVRRFPGPRLPRPNGPNGTSAALWSLFAGALVAVGTIAMAGLWLFRLMAECAYRTRGGQL